MTGQADGHKTSYTVNLIRYGKELVKTELWLATQLKIRNSCDDYAEVNFDLFKEKLTVYIQVLTNLVIGNQSYSNRKRPYFNLNRYLAR